MSRFFVPALVSLLVLSACTSGGANGGPIADRVPVETPAVILFATETPAPVPGDTAAPLSEADIIAPAPSGRSLQPQLENATIDVNQIRTLLPPDAIRAVFPEEVPGIMVTAREAAAAGIDPEVRVIGVSINGESQAYPIPFLSAHEIVNAEVGGKSIAATW